MWHAKASYPNEYLWFVLLSSLDVFFTWIVLHQGGREVNPVAATVMGLHPRALIFYKFAIVIIVVAVCELLARRNERAGRMLVVLGCALTCVPVVVASVQLLTRR